jgi:periplasmic protein TonB
MSEIKHNVNWDQMVFESKNQDYGAYFLRSRYRKHVITASVVGLILLVLLVGPPFIMAKLNNDRKAVIDNSITADLMNINQQEEEAPPPPPPPPPPEQIKQEARFVAPVVVDTVDEKVELATTDEAIATTTNDQVQEEVVEVTEEKPDVVEEEAPVFMVVEEMPVFPGGEAELMKFIATNIKYPDICKENNISGKVYVSFVINEVGKVEKVKVLRGVDPYLDKEAIRVIESMPSWTPGKQRGKAVRVQYNVPINFQLN